MSKYSVYVNSVESDFYCQDGQIVITRKDKDIKSGKVITKIVHADWIVSGRAAVLQIYTKSKEFYAISKLQASEEEKISGYLLSEFGVTMKTANARIKGHVDGTLELNDHSFALCGEEGPIFHIPYCKIEQAQAPGRQHDDIVLNFTRESAGEYLTAIRLGIPKNYDKSAKDILAAITSRVDLAAGTDDYITELYGVRFISPRLELRVRFCNDLVFLYNSDGVQHRIQYSNIEEIHRLMVPKTVKDETKHDEVVVISLANSLRVGQTNYNHLVIECQAGEEADGQGIEGDKDDAVKPLLADELLKHFEDFRVKIYNKRFFTYLSGETGITCSFKTKTGRLYLTDDAFVYVHNPVMIIKYNKVQEVVIAKVDEVAKSTNRHPQFELKVKDSRREYVFTNMDMVTGADLPNIPEKEKDKQRFLELAKKSICLDGIRALKAWLEEHKVRIADRKALEENLRSLENSTESRSRSAKIDVRQKTKADLEQFMGSDASDDEDFNPDAPNEDDGGDEEESFGEGEEEEDADEIEDDGESGSD